ncbi:putative uncharacterized protein [Streptomyces azureus]|uniref:Uncharacterized protein n=1 Tax=Streptomyces azureus TaxID=146537 RepID=A0A0K8PVF6_STRAJ|nr:putative uncharacterized protein [Streptomyces azureus]
MGLFDGLGLRLTLGVPGVRPVNAAARTTGSAASVPAPRRDGPGDPTGRVRSPDAGPDWGKGRRPASHAYLALPDGVSRIDDDAMAAGRDAGTTRRSTTSPA